MENFVAHGSYVVSNAGGYLIQLSSCGSSARVKDAFGFIDNPEISDWLPIEYVPEEGYDDLQPVIDPEGYNISLNLVMKL